jgi:hypothetical protein
MPSGPLSAILPSSRVNVEILDADPTVTPTGGKRNTVGLYAGGLYIHLTAAVDTSWLNLGMLTGAMQLGAGQLLSVGPSGAPPTGLRAFEVIDVDVVDPNDPMISRPQGSVLYRRAGNGWYFMGAGQWRDGNLLGALMSDASTLIGLAGATIGLHQLVDDQASHGICKVLCHEFTFAELAVDHTGDTDVNYTLSDLEETMVRPAGAVWMGARIFVTDGFTGAGLDTVNLSLGSEGHLITAFCNAISGSLHNNSDFGTEDPELQAAEVDLRLVVTGCTLGDLTSGKVRVWLYYR